MSAFLYSCSSPTGSENVRPLYADLLTDENTRVYRGRSGYNSKTAQSWGDKSERRVLNSASLPKPCLLSTIYNGYNSGIILLNFHILSRGEDKLSFRRIRKKYFNVNSLKRGLYGVE